MGSPSIFVTMSSIDDEELHQTIKNAFNNADNPENIFFGVHLSCKSTKIKNNLKSVAKKYKRVKYSISHQKKNNIETLGVGLGRYSAYKFYENQDYVLQIDCHSYLEKSWDTDLIKIFKEAVNEVGDDRLVVTAIPPIYGYQKKKSIVRVGPKTRCSYFKPGALFAGIVPQWGEFDSLDMFTQKFLPSVKVNAACVFGNKNFAKNPGIHKDAIFYDEEITQTYNLFGNGMALVFPNFENFPVRHLDGDMMTRGHRRLFFLDYLDKDADQRIHEKLYNSYFQFVNNPENKEKIDMYKRYVKVDPTRGYFLSEQPMIPKNYRVD